MTIAALGGASAVLAACGGGTATAPPAAASAAATGAAPVGARRRQRGRERGGRRLVPAARDRAVHVQLVGLLRRRQQDGVRDELQLANSRTTPTRRTRSCSPSSRPAARASTTSRSRPRSSSTTLANGGFLAKLDKCAPAEPREGQRAVPDAAVRPERRVHRAQGLGHDRDHLPRQGRQGAGHVVEGLLRPRQGQVLGQDARRRTRPATCSSRRSACTASTSTPPTRTSSRSPARSCWRCGPHLQSIDSDNYPQTLRDGDAVLALAWNGTAYLMQQEDDYKDTGYTVPSEGTIYWVDTWVLLDQAPAPERGLRVPQLDPGAGHPGHREPVRRLRELQRRRRRRCCRPSSSTTRPSTCRTSSSRTCRCPPTRAATSSGPTSGPSSSPRPDGDRGVAMAGRPMTAAAPTRSRPAAGRRAGRGPAAAGGAVAHDAAAAAGRLLVHRAARPRRS